LPEHLQVHADSSTFQTRLRVDTHTEAVYYRHGGIVRFMLGQLGDGRGATAQRQLRN
jgi:aconitate hydratase